MICYAFYMDEETILKQAGLSEEQALVYQTLLEKGPQRASAIASWTGIKRALTYKVLGELELAGLVEKKEQPGTVAIFFPLHPNSLLSTIERKKVALERSRQTLEESLGSLVSKFNLHNGKPSVQFFEGKSGVVRVLDDTLTTTGEILTYLNMDTVQKYFAQENAAYVQKREQKKVKKRVLACINDAAMAFIREKYADDPDYFATTEFRFIETPIKDFQAAMQIYGDKIGFITIAADNLIGTIVEDARIASMQRSMFEALYASAASYEKYLLL
jgi:sugar-specific transcriptional regulator TrmB